MLERIDKKINVKVNEAINSNENMKGQFEIKKNNLFKEQYTKQTLQGLFSRLNSEITTIQKEINGFEQENVKLNKHVEKKE